MNIDEIKSRVRADQYVYTLHADIERKVDGLTLAQVEQAILAGEILEQYPDTGRGELSAGGVCRQNPHSYRVRMAR